MRSVFSANAAAPSLREPLKDLRHVSYNFWKIRKPIDNREKKTHYVTVIRRPIPHSEDTFLAEALGRAEQAHKTRGELIERRDDRIGRTDKHIGRAERLYEKQK